MKIVTGWRGRLLRMLMALDVLRIAFRQYPNPWRAIRLVGKLAELLTAMRGERPTCRYMTAGGNRFTHLHAPSWPSGAFKRHILAELAALDSADNSDRRSSTSVDYPAARLQTIIFAVTKSCDLRCRHCCEWSQLNQPDTLSAEDIAKVVERFQDLGVTQVHFSGGEPLHRLDDILATVRNSTRDTDFWLFTSGFGLDGQVARRMRLAGLRGVNLSLDHWDSQQHDAFRGRQGTFAWAMTAAAAVREAGLALCLTLCPTREFISRDNLQRYADMARDLGAGFIQILEPRNVGRFTEVDVALTRDQQGLLDQFFREMNHDPANANRPAVVYPAFDQRRIGCLGSGWRYVYVDTDGEIHPCPFCRGSVGNALEGSLAEHLDALRRRGCSGPEHGDNQVPSGAGRKTTELLTLAPERSVRS